jgi:hypothetical protein
MAAGLGFKEFTTGDVLTAADANGYLASQVVMVFASAAARTSAIASPQEGMISYLKDTNSTEYYSGSAWVAIASAAAGKVLQVIQATYGTQVNVSTTTFTDTGLSVTITPSSATSRVMIIATHSGSGKDTGDTSATFRLMRDATSIGTLAAIVGTTGSSLTNISNVTISYVDSPATTSATTYKTQLNSPSNIAKAFTGAGSGTSTIIAMEIGA